MLHSSYAKSTKASYRSHLKSYSAFCNVIGVPMVPADPNTVALYATLLSRTLKYGSIIQYLNIISLLHKSLDVQSPSQNFIVKCTLRGIRNTIGDQPMVKLPITPQILYRILSNLDLTKIVDSCIWCACLLMWYGLLRKSNVVGVHKMLRQDVSVCEDGLLVRIVSTKTKKKFVHPPRTLTLTRLPYHKLCPVAAILHYMSITPHLTHKDPLCAIPRKNSSYILTYKQIVSIIRQSVPNEQSDQYACHSFRRGAASWMFCQGMSVEVIRMMGGWESDCFRRYIHVDSAALSKSAVLGMQKGLPNE